jgi:hypothetical protein
MDANAIRVMSHSRGRQLARFPRFSVLSPDNDTRLVEMRSRVE